MVLAKGLFAFSSASKEDDELIVKDRKFEDNYL